MGIGTLLSTLPSELFLVAEFFLALIILWAFNIFFGKTGLYVYIALGIMTANIQVLRLGDFAFIHEPIALGTIVFTSTYFATDILTEIYGPKASQQVVGLGFLAMIVAPCFMAITVAFPAPYPQAIDSAIDQLFSPTFRLFTASLISYSLSQYLDIQIFQKIKDITGGRALWLRSGLSLMGSAFVDTLVFSTLAWVVLAPHPVSWHTLWYSYVLGTFIIRLGATALFTPCLYFFRKTHAQLSRI